MVSSRQSFQNANLCEKSKRPIFLIDSHNPTQTNMKLHFAAFLMVQTLVTGQHSAYQEHYLVGLLNLPNSDVPSIMQNHTSGSYVDAEKSPYEELPYKNVPLVGFSDIEPAFDAEGNKVLGEYFVLSDNGKNPFENVIECILTFR